MARATNSPASRKRRKKVLKYAKGYFGSKSKLFRYAKEAVQHAWQYAYRDRKKKKGEWRGLWIVRLNAACRSAGISYSRFIEGLTAAGIGLRWLLEAAVGARGGCDTVTDSGPPERMTPRGAKARTASSVMSQG